MNGDILNHDMDEIYLCIEKIGSKEGKCDPQLGCLASSEQV